MRTSPLLTDFLKFPVTSGVGILAAVVTAAWHASVDISPLFMDFRAWHGQPWRLVTSALPHVNILHLFFNLYWLWVFGTAVEATFGWFRTAAIYLFFAVGSAAAECAVFDGGVGLSGVGYGLFGLLWVLSRRDERFRNVVDDQTVMLFVVWFFVCIALTATGIFPVGNVAHGMGAIQGVLLAFAISPQRGKRLAIAGLTGLMFVVLAAATVGRPYVNRSDRVGQELAYLAYLEMEAGSNESSVNLYERALQLDDSQAEWWYNLGIANQKLGRDRDAILAYRQVAKLAPNSAAYRETLAGWLAVLAYEQHLAGDYEKAAQLCLEALDLDDRNAGNWFNLGLACEALGRRDQATTAYEKAIALAPDNAEFQAALEALREQNEAM